MAAERRGGGGRRSGGGAAVGAGVRVEVNEMSRPPGNGCHRNVGNESHFPEDLMTQDDSDGLHQPA
ncbi:hypothetical protein EYF80_026572 [Liparis tanakae]|uniref:Uncharacterized protein n=1 Tax=Liparis tanakae TaxID=230148 RepID=A0A4Z2HBN5_9TELE|nr:hypothetical protein EYF80_026572 [Liparis tanakae]